MVQVLLKANPIFILFLLAYSVIACTKEQATNPHPSMNASKSTPISAAEVVKSEEEWKSQLTVEQYRVLRQAGTEMPHGKAYQEFKKQGKGAYHCGGCDALLFYSDQKFDSGCGWPSFYDPAKAENVILKADDSAGMKRVEVICARCHGHLGHVFKGEGFNTPTDQRFCINGVSLKFKPAQP